MKKIIIINIIGMTLLNMNVNLRAENDRLFSSDTLKTEKASEPEDYVPVKVGDKEVLISEDGETIITKEADESTIIIDENEIVKVDERADTTRIKIGKKAITIIEDDNDTSFDLDEFNFDEFNFDEFDGDDFFDEDGDKFKGHWAGFEFGLNNYLDADYSLSRTSENEYMDVNTSKSFGFNFNFAQYSMGFGTEKFGLVTGLGFEWNNYHFDNLNTITSNNGIIIPDTLNPSPSKSKLSTIYFNVPLLLEVQLGGEDRSDRVHISAGVVGGAKIGSFTKMVYKGDSKDKDKVKDDYNLSPFRYGFTARVGYKAINLYAAYYPTPLFEENKGPELYPIHAGISFNF